MTSRRATNVTSKKSTSKVTSKKVTSKKATAKKSAAPAMHPLLVPIARAFAKDPAVVAKTMFSSVALTARGKIFAMVDSRDRFVVKLPAARVASLIGSGAEPWGPGTGRIMKEWVALPATGKSAWLALAKESRDFVGGASESS